VIFITATEDDDGKPEIDYHLARSSGSNNNSMMQVPFTNKPNIKLRYSDRFYNPNKNHDSVKKIP
jgi:hypothetical protein